MEMIKKFAKELSVFGLVIVIFLALFAYRSATYKTFSTINESKLTSMVESKKSFALVVGDSTKSETTGYQSVMTTFCTKNRSTPLYFIDSSKDAKFDDYLKKTLDVSVGSPANIVVKEGKVTAKKDGALEYYYLRDFINEGLK